MLSDNGQALQSYSNGIHSSNGGTGANTSKKKKQGSKPNYNQGVGFLLAGTQMHETAYSKISEPNCNDRSIDLVNDTVMTGLNQTSGLGYPIASQSNGFNNVNSDELKLQSSELQLPGINRGGSKGNNSRPSSKQYIANQKQTLFDSNSQSQVRLRQNGITGSANNSHLGGGSNNESSDLNQVNQFLNQQLQSGVVMSIQRVPPRPHLNQIQRTSGHSTGSHNFKNLEFMKAQQEFNSQETGPFGLVNQSHLNNHSQISHSLQKEHQGGIGPSTSTTGTSVTTHQTPLQQKRKVNPVDNEKGIMTTGNKIPMNGGNTYNHMFNKTVRSGNDSQFYGDMGSVPSSGGAQQHMLVNYSIKGLGQGSLTKLSKRFSGNAAVVEGMYSEQKQHQNRMQNHFVSINSNNLNENSEFSESPAKQNKLQAVSQRGVEFIEYEMQIPQTPTKGQIGISNIPDVPQFSQTHTSQFDITQQQNQSCPATIKRQKVSMGAKQTITDTKNQKNNARHSVISQVSQESNSNGGGNGNIKNQQQTAGGGPPAKSFDQQSLIIKPIKRITFTDKQQMSSASGSQQYSNFKLNQQSFTAPNEDNQHSDDTYQMGPLQINGLKPSLINQYGQSPDSTTSHQRYNSMHLRANSEMRNETIGSENLKSQDHSPFKQFNNVDNEENGRNLVNPFGIKKNSNQSSFNSYMHGNNMKTPAEELRVNNLSQEPISIENQHQDQGIITVPMRQIQMRFGTSTSLESGGLDKGADSVDDRLDTTSEGDQLQQTTNPLLTATQGENQLIGILEEDSEDFDEDDEDDEDPDGDDDMLIDHQITKDRMGDNDNDPFDLEDGALNDTMQRKEMMFGVNGEDVIEEEDMMSDDDNANNGMDDSGAEEFERNQSGDEGTNPNGNTAAAGEKVGKSEKKKKKKKDPNGGNTNSNSPTKTSKKDKKKNNQAQQQNNQNNGGALGNLLSPQIKIMIQNKVSNNINMSSGTNSSKNSGSGQDVKLANMAQKQNSLKNGQISQGGQNGNNQSSGTPNQQHSKGKSDKLSMSIGKNDNAALINNANQSQKVNKDQLNQAQNINASQNSNNNNQPQPQISMKELKKKNKQKNVALIHSMPKNLEEEQQKFFESDCKINPIFDYENPALATKYLSQFKEPNDEYMQIAKNILDGFLQVYGSETNYLSTEGNIITQEETEKYFMDYLEALGVADQVVLNFCKNKVAPTSVTHDPKGGKSKINIGLPIEYREGRIMGVLHHEIGTHFLRKYNEKFQCWYKKREKYELKNCIQTEEGFASINQLFEMCKDDTKKPFLFKAALNYYSAYMASKMSFVDLFNDLEKYIDNPKRRWKCVVRVKRGIMDTGEAGGLYKDQVYLEGAIQILQDRQNIDFLSLYCGKISLEDLKRPMIEKRIKKDCGLILPTFMSNMEEYNKTLDIIAKTNYIQ